ncbi:hypothetical protein R83H12_01041 [Fibrobacteria bacterium R8-3-H12]
MKHKILFIVPIFFLFSSPCQAQVEHDNLFSLDISYALTSLLNQGWGIGFSYEKKAVDWLSFTGVFGHMTFLTGIKDLYCTSVNLSLFGNYYPLSNGLDKLYLSIGNGSDFMNYFGNAVSPESTNDVLIHITPLLGWKFNPFKYLMIDVSTGYKFIISSSQNYNEIKNYVNSGFRYSLGFKIFFKEMKKERSEN